MNNFSLCKKRCTITKNPNSLLMILISLQFILFCVPKMILYQIVVRMSKRRFFYDVVHFSDEENIVTYVDFDCGFTFFPETPAEVRQINRERNYISRSCERPQCILSNDQHICSVDEQHSSNFFLNPYILWNMVPAAFISLDHTNDTYSMSNQYPQQTTHQSRTDS